MDTLQGAQEDVFTVTMPTLSCSSPIKVHPDAPHLIQMGGASLREWCRRILSVCERFQLPTAKHLFSVDHNLNSGYGFLVTLYYANAVCTERVVRVLKLVNWFFMVDNCVEEPSMFGDDPAKCAHLIDSCMAAIFGTQTPASSTAHHHNPAAESSADDLSTNPSHAAHEELAHILASAAAEWWSEMCVDMPLPLQSRLCESLREYLSAILKETPFREAHKLADVEDYLQIRSDSIGWYPLAWLTEYTLCMEMGEEATSPLLVALRQSICESIILVNDVTSFRKEYEGGDHFNIVMVLCSHKLQAGCCSRSGAQTGPALLELATPERLQECMNEACEMIKERNELCLSTIDKIKQDRKLMAIPGMGAFFEAMENYVPANMYWHLTSERYWPQASFLISNRPSTDLIVNNFAKILVSRPLLLRRPCSI